MHFVNNTLNQAAMVFPMATKAIGSAHALCSLAPHTYALIYADSVSKSVRLVTLTYGADNVPPLSGTTLDEAAMTSDEVIKQITELGQKIEPVGHPHPSDPISDENILWTLPPKMGLLTRVVFIYKGVEPTPPVIPNATPDKNAPDTAPVAPVEKMFALSVVEDDPTSNMSAG